MATNDFNLSRTELVKAALRRLGNSRPDSIAQANAVEALNLLIRQKDESARWFWAISNTETSLTTVADQRTYATGATSTTIATNIVGIENLQIYTSGTYDPPLTELSKSESMNTFYREGTGRPLEFHLQKGTLPSANVLHLFPTPDAAYTLKYNYRRSLAEFDASTDNPDVPQHAFITLIALLAHYLAPEYGVDVNAYQILQTEADKAWANLLGNNAENYTPAPARTVYF